MRNLFNRIFGKKQTEITFTSVEQLIRYQYEVNGIVSGFSDISHYRKLFNQAVKTT